LNGKGECILFDLESLERIDDATEIDIDHSMDRYLMEDISIIAGSSDTMYKGCLEGLTYRSEYYLSMSC
jgi:hypothetical protein